MKENKKQIVIATSILVVTTILLLGLTYAYYKTRISGNTKDKSISVTSKKLEITYSDGNGVIEGNGIEPGYTTTKTFTVENTGDETLSYSIKLDNITNTFTRTEDWTYVLKKGDVEVSSGVLPTEDSYILDTISIDSKRTDSYSLTITYANPSDVDQSVDMGKSLSLRVNIDDFSNPYANNKDSLAYNIIENAKNKTNGTELLASPKSKPAEEISTKWGTGKFEYETVTTGSLCSEYYPWKVGDSEAAAQSGSSVSSYDDAVGKYVYDECSNWTKYLESYDSSTSTLKFRTEEYKNETTLSVTQDDLGTSYYYRGDIEDNYVNFAGMCWRIVRIAGDGSVKMTLAAQKDCSEITNSDTETAFIGKGDYGYDSTSKSTSGDTLYKMNYLNPVTSENGPMVRAFYDFQTTKLASYLDKLKSGDWCLGDTAYTRTGSSNSDYTYTLLTDTSSNYLSKTTFYYDAYARITGNNKDGYSATLKCNGTKLDKFRTVEYVSSEAPMYVSALTIDEVAFAGGSVTGANKNYYLNNNASSNWWWTISPYAFDGASDVAFHVYLTGNLYTISVDASEGAFRPAIQLESNIQITSGDGTKANPYVVS